VNKEEQFSVINSNNNRVVSYDNNTASFEGDNMSNASDTTPFENQNDIPSSSSAPTTDVKEPNADKESYSARFEQIFGKKTQSTLPATRHRPRYYTVRGTNVNFDLGTIFAKGREHYLKENQEAKIGLLNHDNSGNTSYPRGHIIKGEVILLLPPNPGEEHEEKNKHKKIKGMKITLSGIENAFAQGLQRTNTIEKYEKSVELDLNKNGNGGKNGDNIPFEFQIPEAINQSYTGKYSEYFWGLEAKVNIAWSSDINARTIIEIV
jgi:hypothetical protein